MWLQPGPMALQWSCVHGLPSLQMSVPSSMTPLQLSSAPLQVSVTGTGALQLAASPTFRQCAVPLQTPWLQWSGNDSATAQLEHVQLPESGTQRPALQPEPGGQPLLSRHGAEQKPLSPSW